MDDTAPVTPTGTTREPAPTPDPAAARTMLIVSTLGFAICFWAWALLSPLAVTLRDELGLTTA